MQNIFSVRAMLGRREPMGELPSSMNIYREVFRMAAPSMLEMMLMSLIGSIDTIMVGRVSSAAISAVGLTTQPRMLFLCIFFALNVGLTAVVARRKGEGRREEANRTMRNALVIVTLISVVMCVVSLSFSRDLVLLAGAKEDTVDMAEVYFRIIVAAIPLNAISMCISSAQRGVGNTRVTMIVNGTANIVNVIFNFLLIEGRFGFPRLEVTGAAIATFIGFVVGTSLSIVSILRKNSFLRLERGQSWRLDKDTLAPFFKLSGSAMLEQIALRVGFFTFARIVADLGTDYNATHQICMQFLNITFTMGDGIGVASTSLVGQSLGRGRPDLAVVYGKAGQRLALVFSLVMAVVIIIFREPLIMLFNREPQILAIGVPIMVIVAIFQPFQTSSVVLTGCLRGAGDTKFVAVVMLVCVAIIRPLTAMLVVNVLELGLIGAWIAMLFDMILRLISVYVRFAGGKWSTIKV